MFDLERFVSDCCGVIQESDAKIKIAELVTKAVKSPSDLLGSIGEPTRAGINRIYVSSHLTILNLVWGPEMYLPPHDHRMWAVIGLYGGSEENTFYRREDCGLRKQGVRVLEAKQVVQLGIDAIHSVKNPLLKLTGALHIYGGQFFETPRSEWDPNSLEERPFSIERTVQTFEESNRRVASLALGDGHHFSPLSNNRPKK